MLTEHNRYRALHCAPPMTWSKKVAAVAQRWANELRDKNCAFDHNRGTIFGENLAYFSPVGSGSAADVVKGWYSEVKLYKFGAPGFSMRTGHFTQVVWKGTTELGCGVAQCANAELWVCNYGPAGNVQSLYRDNVKPTGCGR